MCKKNIYYRGCKYSFKKPSSLLKAVILTSPFGKISGYKQTVQHQLNPRSLKSGTRTWKPLYRPGLATQHLLFATVDLTKPSNHRADHPSDYRTYHIGLVDHLRPLYTAHCWIQSCILYQFRNVRYRNRYRLSLPDWDIGRLKSLTSLILCFVNSSNTLIAISLAMVMW